MLFQYAINDSFFSHIIYCSLLKKLILHKNIFQTCVHTTNVSREYAHVMTN